MTPQPNTQLSAFIHPDQIVCNIPAASRDQGFMQLIETLHQRDKSINVGQALAAIIERENVAPTVIADGIALPHARLENVQEPSVAVGISPDGITFSEDMPPIHVIILILTPKADPGAYLRVVSALSKRLSSDTIVEQLVKSTSSDAVFGILAEGETMLPSYLSARDVMNDSPRTLKEGDTLAVALETFVRHRLLDIPVVDEDGDIRGVIAMDDILRLSLPQHLLWMEDLSPILHFQPFAELLKRDHETKIADFMSEQYASISPETPAIQLAKVFLMQEVRQIHVLEGRKLLGIVTLNDFITELFWA